MQVAIFGGTGFVGSYILEALHAAGHRTSLLVRPGSEHKVPNVEHARIVPGDLHSATAIAEVLRDCDAVVYLVGILRAFPRRGITFEGAQFEGAARVADAAAEQGVRRFLLMSANGIEVEVTPYQRTKRDAERYVEKLGFDYTVFRPSVIFGNPRGRMEFATQLYRDMVRPPLPAIGFYSGWRPSRGPVLMSPVHIHDVADAFAGALEDTATFGRTYQLCGPEAVSWTEMLRRIAAATGRRKLVVPVPIGAMELAATLFDWLPVFPVTRDQLTMLRQNNVCESNNLPELIHRAPLGFTVANLAYLQA